MAFTFSLTLEIVLALLLVVMIWYSVILNRRLTRFRGNREQMEKLAATFNDATTRATASKTRGVSVNSASPIGRGAYGAVLAPDRSRRPRPHNSFSHLEIIQN
mgnify:CR=1 FL=1